MFPIDFGFNTLKGCPSDLGTKLGKKKKNKTSSLYSQSLLIFIHKTPVVECRPTSREIRYLLRPRSTTTGNTVYFYMRSSLIYILKIHKRSFITASNEDIMENIFVMMWNLSVISQWIFPLYCF